jgi:hypothetical protein
MILHCYNNVCLSLVIVNMGLHTAGDIQMEWVQLQHHCSAIALDMLSPLYKLRQHHMLGLVKNRLGCAQWEKVEWLDYGGTSTVFWFETCHGRGLTETSSWLHTTIWGVSHASASWWETKSGAALKRS